MIDTRLQLYYNRSQVYLIPTFQLNEFALCPFAATISDFAGSKNKERLPRSDMTEVRVSGYSLRG